MKMDALDSNVSYSCSDGYFVSRNSITPEIWQGEVDNVRSAALASAVFALLFALIGIPTNLFILVSILWQRLYKEPTYILLLNLTVANLLVCVTVMPFTIVSGFAGGFVFGSNDWTRCKVCQMGVFLTCLTLFTLHILALLSVDRYLFIKYPYKYHTIVSKTRVLMVAVTLWILCATIAICPLFGFGDVHYALSLATCKLKFYGETKLASNIYYSMVVAIECLLVPLPILFIFNGLLIWTVQKHIRKVYITKKEIGCSHEELIRKILQDLEKSKFKKQRHLIQVFGGILLAYILTSLPTILYIFQVAITGGDDSHPAHSVFVFICILFSSVVHPTMQACIVPEIKKALPHFCCAKIHCCNGISKSNGLLASNKCHFRLKQYVDLLCIASLPYTNETDISNS